MSDLIPKQRDMNYPVLETMLKLSKKNGGDFISNDVIFSKLIKKMKISSVALSKRYDDNPHKHLIVYNRFEFALNDLGKEGLIDRNVKTHSSKLTAKGTISIEKHKAKQAESEQEEQKLDEQNINVMDQLQKSVDEYNANVREKLKNYLFSDSSEGAYRLKVIVRELLKKMGYRLSEEDDESYVPQEFRDAGVDGVIYQDALGVSRIYYQVKRYSSSIQEGQIKEFIGTLKNDFSTDKGIFITTSKFTKGAREAVRTRDIRLIDGEQFLDLLFKYHVLIEEDSLPIYRLKKDEHD